MNKKKDIGYHNGIYKQNQNTHTNNNLTINKLICNYFFLISINLIGLKYSKSRLTLTVLHHLLVFTKTIL